jgi:hypothetical protein
MTRHNEQNVTFATTSYASNRWAARGDVRSGQGHLVIVAEGQKDTAGAVTAPPQPLEENDMSTNLVTTIDPTPPLLTLINVHEVTPEKQAKLLQLLADATEKVMRHQPGFVSVNIHRSVDSTRVVN